ncbi:tartrate dehydrogenase [Sphaerisporangium perillae]|uniref:tartrate dehydrogenase n=1 Tax=Sphaerisporangium perillae TaxID=2935860 RepID=UPI00200F891C|nr:tartrate dehydrogenase [Sphaerisporangium perillae]
MKAGEDRSYRIASIPGDGIGVEVTAVARKVLDATATLGGFSLEWTTLDWSCARYLETGSMMPDDGIQTLSGFDSIFLGAVGHPSVPDHVSLWGLLIPIRRAFQQYVNLRPARLFAGVTSPLRDRGPEDIDMVIVRENSEGEYSQIGGRHNVGTPAEFAVQESVFTRQGIERIVRFAFDLARTRGRSVVAATKSNGIVHTMPFWDEVAQSVADEYADVRYERAHIDALAARMVLAPHSIDVVVGSNLFGDILSDLAAAICGGLGFAPSGNVNPSSEFPSMFESVHGSAPDIAGRGIANPVAQVLSGAMMLRHLGEGASADRIDRAVETLFSDAKVRTPDRGGADGTDAVGDELVRLVGLADSAA